MKGPHWPEEFSISRLLVAPILLFFFVAPSFADSVRGQWGPVLPWPQVPVSAANLPDGRILTWSGSERATWPVTEQTYSSTWDPKTGSFTEIFHPSHNMFCADLAMTEDGQVFVNGGRNAGNSPWTSLFDFRDDSWTRKQNMATGGRWYPTTLQLADGDMFTALGNATNAKNPDRWDSTTSSWRVQNGIDFDAMVTNTYASYGERNWWPLLHLAPNGKIFHAGPTPRMHWINPTGTGSATPVGSEFTTWYTKHGTSVMYDTGKLLIAGGWSNGGTLASTNRAMTIDLNGPGPVIATTQSMAFQRKFQTGVILPNGEVLVVGGNTSGLKFSDSGAILAPEVWNPASGTWRQMAPMSVPRNYHSIAILMTDGRVLAGGGGYNSSGANQPFTHQDAQVFTPPYLFDASGALAVRPQILSGPGVVEVAADFQLQTDSPVSDFSLIKMSATTHGINTDLRRFKPAFRSVGANTYELSVPANPNVATPGYWMVFAVDSAGVPSEAHVLRITAVDARLENLALRGTATQSSTQAGDFGAANAIDGDLSGDDGSGSMNHTGLDNEAWWELDLGRVYDLESVRLWNRTDCCADRLRDVHLFVSDAPFVSQGVAATQAQPGVSETYMPGPAAHQTDIPVGRTGRFLRVQLNGSGYLHLGEVQAFGPGGLAGLQYEYFHGNWDALPNFDALTPIATGSLPNFSLGPKTRNDYYGFRFTGRIQIPTAGTYTFYTRSDDGSQLFIDGALLVNNDGLHGALERQGSRTLSAGTHDIVVTFFEKMGGDSLLVSYAGPGLAKQPIPTSALSPGPDAGNGPVLLAQPPGPQAETVGASMSISGGTPGLQYKWSFGDGTPETSYSGSNQITHSYAQAGRYVVVATVLNPSTGQQELVTFTQIIHPPLPAAKPRASSPIAAHPTRSQVWNVNPDNDTVSVIHSVNANLLAEIPVGIEPRSVAVSPLGEVWVTNKGDGSISILDPANLREDSVVQLPRNSQPHGIVFGGGSAYVALEATGEVLRLDDTSGSELGRRSVGDKPRHLALPPDAGTLYVSRFVTPPLPQEHTDQPVVDDGNRLYGGEVLALNPGSLAIQSTIVLQHSDRAISEHSGPGIPNYLGPLAIAPDGASGYVPSKQDNILGGALRGGGGITFDQTVRAVSSRLSLGSDTEDFVGRIDHDNASVASHSVFGPYGLHLFTALEGNREVAISDGTTATELTRFDVGRAPQGLALSNDGMRLYVHNFLSRTVQVFDISEVVLGLSLDVTELASVSVVGSEALASDVLRGKQLFYDARDDRLALDSYMSCASCHNAAGEDGRVWDLTSRGEGLRNTISLEGRLGTAHGFLHWSANFDEVQDFEGQIRGLAGGRGLMADADFIARQDPLGAFKTGASADLDALAAYLQSLDQFEVSPSASADGSLSAAAESGRQLFVAENCESCHVSPRFTNSNAGNLEDVGTRTPFSGNRLGEPLTGIDTPTLLGVWNTAPFLHDGSAATLEDAIAAHQGSTLSAGERSLVASYLRELTDPTITDSDGDGVPDATDVFPADPSEWADRDGDGVGDNGDVFPDDPSEDSDRDGDGIGDNSDPFPDDPTNGGQPQVYEVRISASLDDAEETQGGTVKRGSSDLEMTNDRGQLQTVGLRFRNVAVPAGASITRAWLQFTTDEVSSGNALLNVQAEATDDAGAFGSAQRDLSNRSRTAAAVSWPVPPWSIVGESAAPQRSPDLASVLREVVSRPGWNAGQDLVILIDGTGLRTAESWDGRSTAATLLHVEYGGTGGGNLPPTVTSPGPQTTPTGTVVNLPISASDPDGDPLSFTASGLPAGISIDSASGLLSGTPTIAGTSSVQVTASDGVASASATFAWNVTSPGTVVVEVSVTDGKDDVEERSSGSVFSGSSDLELTNNGGDLQTVGVRFRGVAVPQGATIQSAYLQFHANEASSGATNLTLRAEASDDAAPFSSQPRAVSGRSFTSASAAWVVPAWPVVGAAGAAQRSADLTTLVQEVVQRSGWASGNAMVFSVVGSGDRVADSFNGNAAGAPRLHVEYGQGGGSSQTLDLRVANSVDDAEERLSGSVTRGSSDLELINNNGEDQWVGIRFRGVTVPRGATIETATIQFQVDEVTTSPTRLTLRTEAADVGGSFLGDPNNISGRTPSTASVAWDVAPWTIVGAASSAQRTPDLKAIVQEIIDRPGWQSGQPIVFLINGTGRRTAEAFDGSVSGAPLLHLRFR